MLGLIAGGIAAGAVASVVAKEMCKKKSEEKQSYRILKSSQTSEHLQINQGKYEVMSFKCNIVN